jgi:REP element-mobilizing transposase RayT
MMTKARSQQVCLEATPYYHCISRCVRKAFLCGVDFITKQSYEHRRGWLEETIIRQAEVFAIDVAAYAVMSNHYHVVLHINKNDADIWSLDDVIERWHALYKGNALSQRYLMSGDFSEAEYHRLSEFVEIWRERLMNISWFMKRLNECISRQANYEDNCTGRFWEGRFKSQALLDEKALAACLAYVDLNPVRAGMAKTPDTSDYTSIKIRAKKAKTAHTVNHPRQQAKGLMPFVGNPRDTMSVGLPFKLTDYLELVELTGRQIRHNKKGYIEKHQPPILQRLGIEVESWMKMTTSFETTFKDLVGNPTLMDSAIALLDRKRRPGIANCKALLS